MSAPIIPGVTWGRSRQAASFGRWHLLAELRRNVSGAEITGRWGRVPAGGTFALAVCGQVVNDPSWEPQPPLEPYAGWGLTTPFPVPAKGKGDWCLPCVEAIIRQQASVPA